MPIFYYQAINATGQSVAGDIDAEGVQQAIAQLHADGLLVQSIGLAPPTPPDTAAEARQTVTKPVRKPALSPGRSAGESVEQAVLRAHMATILERGRAIEPALRAYADEMPIGWQRRQLVTLCDVISRNDPAAATAALAKMPECWIPLLTAASSSPDPGQVLREYFAETRRTDDLNQKWWLTFAYPVAILALTAIVLTTLSIFVIPEFRTIFTEFGLQLPDFTRLVLNIGHFLSRWGLLLFIALAAVFAIMLLTANRLLPAESIAWLSSRFRPPFARRTAIARFAHFTADLLDADVGMPDALRIAGYAVNQSRIRRAAWQLAGDIETKTGFSPDAYRRPLTATVAYALSPEVPADARVRLLRDISGCHADRVRIGLSWAGGIIEPVAIFFVGFAVGMTVLALFLPLVKLVEGLSN